MKKISILAVFATMLLFASCKEDGTDVDCSTVTFSGTIFPLVDQNCNTAGCHAAGTQNPEFSTYEQIKAMVDNGNLKKQVLDDRTMPPNGSLSNTELAEIQCWLDAGAPE
ncbi:MAG: cytochrome c [Bacteroidetes bacterium]|nr:MAG: cytochrome c [Bacteroidota bacterium]